MREWTLNSYVDDFLAAMIRESVIDGRFCREGGRDMALRKQEEYIPPTPPRNPAPAVPLTTEAQNSQRAAAMRCIEITSALAAQIAGKDGPAAPEVFALLRAVNLMCAEFGSDPVLRR